MSHKVVEAGSLKVGRYLIIEDEAYRVVSIEKSKSGKHGHAKARIEAVGMIDGNKKIIVVPGHERLEVPLVDKRKGQVLSIGDKISLMDLESFETMDVDCPDESVKSMLEESGNAEYWDIEGVKLVKRKL